MRIPFGLTAPAIRKIYIWTLILIAIHSITFGLCLIIFPCSVLQFFGFEITQKFFATQGGVFHLIISFAYIRAAMNPEQSRDMVILACITKFGATIFLISYYLFGTPILLVLFSGFVDFLMGAAILYTYLLFASSYRREERIPVVTP
jgi:hypothetical protein